MRAPLPDAFKGVVEKVFGKDKVIVVTVGQPSQSILRWYKNWAPPEGAAPVDRKGIGTLYDQLMKSVNGAIKGKDLASVTFIWMQGEADAEKGWGAVYEKSFYGVLDQFKKDLQLKEINYVIGRINDFWLTSKGVKDGDMLRDLQAKMGEAHPNGAWENTDDLNTGVNPWGGFELEGGHFPNPAYRVLGQRFARKACLLIDPATKLDERIFDAVFFDSSKDVASHLAIGKNIKVTMPVQKDSPPGLASLTDGKFGGTDPADKQWVVFPASGEGVELTVDLGIKQSVTGIGVNMCINPQMNAVYPKGMAVFISDDGTNYRLVNKRPITFPKKVSASKEVGSKPQAQSYLVLVDAPGEQGQFVRVKLESNNSPMYVDEIVVNPTAKSALIRNGKQ